MGSLYLYYVIGLMIILPIISILVEINISKNNFNVGDIIAMISKWFIFWGIGLRSLTGGLSQSINPGFTASLLQVKESSFVVIRELGFANISMGLIAVISLFAPQWRKAAAFCGGLFLGIAGVLHISRIPEGINSKETIAMISDLFIFLIMTVYMLHSLKFKQKKVLSSKL